MAAVEKGYDKDPDVQLAMKQAMVKRFTSKELSQLVKMADITEAELKTYYDQNPDEFNRPGQVRASHIVLGDEAGANQLLAALKADIAKQPAKARATFGEYASKTTIDDATKARKGDLGFLGNPVECRQATTKCTDGAQRGCKSRICCDRSRRPV